MPIRWDLADTIAAVASAPGNAPRGIVRVSGPRALECVESCCPGDTNLPREGLPRAIPSQFRADDPLGDLPCDLLVWPTARSYCGQPTVEIHTLGSPPLLDAVVARLCRQGARLAEPGEFTLRAFLAGRIDLTQAEAVLGVIDARGEEQLQTALDQLAGGLARPLHELRDQLIDLLARLEAGLDFVEEDIEFISPRELEEDLSAAAQHVEQILDRMTSRLERSDEITIVLRGAPNVGKSSLLNALAERAAALVSSRAGTTRDYVSAEVSLGGRRCRIIDTAGVEAAAEEDAVSEQAHQMSNRWAERADVQLLCLDASRPLNAWERRQLNDDANIRRLVVITKIDLAGDQSSVSLPATIDTSSRTGRGIPELLKRIADCLQSIEAESARVVAGTALRCRDSLVQTLSSLRDARRVTLDGLGEELAAAELRAALDSLGLVVGAIYTDDLLDRIFSRFCIGK